MTRNEGTHFFTAPGKVRLNSAEFYVDRRANVVQAHLTGYFQYAIFNVAYLDEKKIDVYEYLS